MPRYVALLRSIVIAKRRPTSAILGAWASTIGAREIGTVGATGNLVFSSRKRPTVIARELEAACAETFGASTAILVKSAAEWHRLISANPFPAEAESRPANLLIWAMRAPISDSALARLRQRAHGEERIAMVDSGDFYIWYGAGEIVRSRLPAACTPTGLGGFGTSRNWNTARRIAAAL